MRELDLQSPLACLGPLAKNFEDQARTVQYFSGPYLLQIPLLHRTQRAVNDDQLDFFSRYDCLQVVQLARPEQSTRANRTDRFNPAIDDFKIKCSREADCFTKPSFR
jgi:hypothetical protein